MQFSMIFEAQMADPTREHERQVLPRLRRAGGVRRGDGLRPHLGGRAPRPALVRAHERPRDLPDLGRGQDVAHPHRPWRRVHAVRLQPPGAGRPSARPCSTSFPAAGSTSAAAGVRPSRRCRCAASNADDTYPQVEESLRMLAQIWRERRVRLGRAELKVPPPDPAAAAAGAAPAAVHGLHQGDTVELAAEYGIGALVLGLRRPGRDRPPALALRRLRSERSTGERNVSDHLNKHFTALCPTIVLDDARRGDADRRPRAALLRRSRSPTGTAAAPSPSEADHDGDVKPRCERAADDCVAQLHEAKIPVGPDDAQHLQASTRPTATPTTRSPTSSGSIDAGADEIMCLIQMGTVPQDVCMETIRQWGEQVIPHFR